MISTSFYVEVDRGACENKKHPAIMQMHGRCDDLCRQSGEPDWVIWNPAPYRFMMSVDLTLEPEFASATCDYVNADDESIFVLVQVVFGVWGSEAEQSWALVLLAQQVVDQAARELGLGVPPRFRMTRRERLADVEALAIDVKWGRGFEDVVRAEVVAPLKLWWSVIGEADPIVYIASLSCGKRMELRNRWKKLFKAFVRRLRLDSGSDSDEYFAMACALRGREVFESASSDLLEQLDEEEFATAELVLGAMQ
ncbi:hypothetical protein ACQCX5_12080 [Propionibacteriaceae bacterium G57]|uniref:hypothetical protein n=1 Tax=Aestuariimicrobium sp. G57 TaxID=3418485 RepID=UPI003DA73B2F